MPEGEVKHVGWVVVGVGAVVVVVGAGRVVVVVGSVVVVSPDVEGVVPPEVEGVVVVVDGLVVVDVLVEVVGEGDATHDVGLGGRGEETHQRRRGEARAHEDATGKSSDPGESTIALLGCGGRGRHGNP
jgi:xanthine/uracil permease